MAKNKSILQYKWLYLWIAAAGLLTLGLLMILSQDLGQAIVLVITAIILILSVIIRIVPLIKTLRGVAARLLNILAMLIDLGVGFAVIFIALGGEDLAEYGILYPFLIGFALFFQGLVYVIETIFLKTKGEVFKFIIHIFLLTLGTVIMARFDSFTTEYFRWVVGVAFLLCFLFATIDGIFHYNGYRKKYSAKKAEDNDVEKIGGADWAKTAVVTESTGVVVKRDEPRPEEGQAASESESEAKEEPLKKAAGLEPDYFPEEKLEKDYFPDEPLEKDYFPDDPLEKEDEEKGEEIVDVAEETEQGESEDDKN